MVFKFLENELKNVSKGQFPHRGPEITFCYLHHQIVVKSSSNSQVTYMCIVIYPRSIWILILEVGHEDRSAVLFVRLLLHNIAPQSSLLDIGQIGNLVDFPHNVISMSAI